MILSSTTGNDSFHVFLALVLAVVFSMFFRESWSTCRSSGRSTPLSAPLQPVGPAAPSREKCASNVTHKDPTAAARLLVFYVHPTPVLMSPSLPTCDLPLADLQAPWQHPALAPDLLCNTGVLIPVRAFPCCTRHHGVMRTHTMHRDICGSEPAEAQSAQLLLQPKPPSLSPLLLSSLPGPATAQPVAELAPSSCLATVRLCRASSSRNPAPLVGLHRRSHLATISLPT